MGARIHKRAFVGLAAALLAAGMPAVARADAESFPVSVVVMMPDGRPAAHVDVVVQAMRSITEGEGDIPIAEGMTDGNGAFNARVPLNDELLTEAAFHGGFLNIESSAFVADAVATAQGRAGDALSDVDGLIENAPNGVQASQAMTLLTAVQATPVPINVSGNLPPAPEADENTVRLLLAETIGDPIDDPTNAPDNISTCWFGQWGIVQGPLGKETIIGELHTYQDMTARFIYNESANSDIGVGYSEDGQKWRVSGSVHMGNKSSVENSGVEAPAYWGRQILAHFNYVKERRYYYCYGWRVATQYRARSRFWHGDEFPGNDVSSGDGYYAYKDAKDEGCGRCAKFIKNQTFTRNKERTKKYGVAVSVFGASLTSQTSFDTNHKLYYKFGSYVGEHWLIGNNNPPSLSGVIYAY